MKEEGEFFPWFSAIRQDGRFKPLILTIVAFFFLISCDILIISWYTGVQHDSVQGTTELDVSRVGILLEKTLSRRLDLIDSLAAFVQANPTKNELNETFIIYASALNTSVAGIDIISLAPGNIQDYVYPKQNNGDILGHDVLNQSKQEMQKEIHKTMDTGKTVIIPPHRRNNDELILVGRKAVTINGKYWGLVTVSVELDPIFEETGLNASNKVYQIAIRDEQGRVFFGERAVFYSNPVSYFVTLPDSHWEVGAIPSSANGDNQAFHLLLVKILLGIIIILMTFLVYGLSSRHEDLTRVVAERTRELQISNERLSDENKHRRQYEAALVQTNKKIQVFGQLARTDIANQVFIINGFVEILKEKMTDPVLFRFVEHIEDAASFIQSRLIFSAQFQDLGKKEPVWHSISSTIVFAISYLDTREIKREIDLGEIEVYADVLLEKAFFNLFENSLIHGGNISFIRIRHHVHDSDLTLIIEDDGVGIPDDQKEEIFLKGMGSSSHLGLFFTREILSITDITIKEVGKTGEGSVFEILVPPQGWRYCKE